MSNLADIQNADVVEYLKAFGFRREGQRGKFNRECLLAIEVAIEAGATFKNWDADTRRMIKIPKTNQKRKRKINRSTSVMTAQKPVIKESAPVRGATKVKFIEDNGMETLFDMHSWGCGSKISHCRCKEIGSPRYISPAKTEFVL